MDDKAKKIVTIGVSTLDDVKQRVAQAFRGKPQGAHISFSSVDRMWKALTPKGWEWLQVMTGAGPMTIREAARRVGRDVKAVHGDVHALLKSGVLDRTEDGRVEFPYDAIHVDFMITKAA
jgi:predicted transcriptional regulator